MAEEKLLQELPGQFTEMLDVLNRLSQGDAAARVTNVAEGPLGRFQTLINEVAAQMEWMVNFNHELAIGISEQYDTLNRIAAGDFTVRAPEGVENELLALLGKLINKQSAAFCETLERKNIAEREVQGQLSFMETLLETIPNPIFYKDANGRYVGCNRAFEAYIGISRDDLFGMTPDEIWPSELADRYIQADRSLLHNQGKLTYEADIRCADGSIRSVIFNKASYGECDGAPVGLVGVVLDITERKQAEEATRNALRQTKDIIDFLPDATFVIDRDKRVIAWNRAMEELSGVEKEAILGQGDYAYALPFYGERRPILIDLVDHDPEVVKQNYRHVRLEGGILFAETYIPEWRGTDGIHLWGTASPLFDSNGMHVGAIESIRDITEQKRVEQAFKFRNILLTAEQEASLDGILVVDDLGKILSYNRRFQELMEIPDHLLSDDDDQPVLQWVTERVADPEAFLDKVRTLYSHKSETCRDEVLLADGRIMDRFTVPLLDDTGQYYGRFWSFRDVTEQRRSDETIRNALQQMTDIIEFLPDATFVIDQDKRVIAWNRAIENLTGVSKQEMLGKGGYAYAIPFYNDNRPLLIDLLGPEKEQERIQLNYTRIHQEGQTLFTEVFVPSFRGGGGRYFWATATPLFDRSGRQVGAIESIRDISDYKMAEIEQIRMRSELAYAHVLETIMIRLGHDLKTPLTPLFIMLPLLKKQLTDPAQIRKIDTCLKSAHAIKGLADKTGLLARLSDGAKESNKSVFSLAELVDQVSADYSVHIFQRQIFLRNQVPRDLTLYAAETQIRELLGNLISNAVNFSDNGGMVTISASLMGTRVSIQVHDEGVGISSDNLSRIFDDFFKADESRHNLQASGLGLSICKQIVKNHHGRIWAESPGLGCGTTVHVELDTSSARECSDKGGTVV